MVSSNLVKRKLISDSGSVEIELPGSALCKHIALHVGDLSIIIAIRNIDNLIIAIRNIDNLLLEKNVFAGREEIAFTSLDRPKFDHTTITGKEISDFVRIG